MIKTRFRSIALITAGLACVAIVPNVMAAFTVGTFGKGKITDGNSVGDFANNMLGKPGYEAISMSDIALAASAFGSASYYVIPASSSLTLFDRDNDGRVSRQEFVDMLNRVSGLNNVNTGENGIYAQACATELGAITAVPPTLANLQTAIDACNNYTVHPPKITTNAIAFDISNHTSGMGLGLIDGDNLSSHSNLLTTISTVQLNSQSVVNPFAIQNGQLSIASGVSYGSIAPGIYTVDVNALDQNVPGYGKAVNSSISVTVSNPQGCVVNPTIADSDFTTNSTPSTSIDGARVSISGNHDADDLLFVKGATVSTSGSNVTYTNIGNGISGVYNKSTGQLVFSGSTTEANWISIFGKVGYIHDASGTPSSGTRNLIFSLSNKIVYQHVDGYDHFYKFIPSSGINFNDAFTAAENSTLFGLQGYLATVTSAAEQAYILPKLNGAGWIGGCDRLEDSTVQSHCRINPSDLNNLKGVAKSSWSATTGLHSMALGEGYFYWVTGPERLEFIIQDIKNCNSSSDPDKQRTYPIASSCNHSDSLDNSASNYQYHNFKYTEPNNYRHDGDIGENYLHLYGNGEWNDWRLDGDTTTGGGIASGYVIEYGGFSNETVPDLTASSNYNISSDGQYCSYASS